MKIKYILLAALAAFAAVPLSAAVPEQAKNQLLQNVYALKGGTTSQLPLTKTERGTITAEHVLRGMIERGQTSVNGVNAFGKEETFVIGSHKFEFRGLDYAWLKAPDRHGLKIGDSTKLTQGQKVFMLSPKSGLQEGVIGVLPDSRYDDLRFYTNIGSCGDSGSPVVNEKGEIIGIFVARTGAPGDPYTSVVLKINKILDDSAPHNR